MPRGNDGTADRNAKAAPLTKGGVKKALGKGVKGKGKLARGGR